MMLLLLMFVAGAVAQHDYNNDDERPPIADDRIVIYNDDAGSLPDDVRRLVGSTQFGRPMPYGRHGLIREGGAGIGEDYADGKTFGIDIDPNDIELTSNDDERSYIEETRISGSSSILPLLGIDSRPLGTSSVQVSTHHASDGYDDDDNDYSFDLSQFGISTSDSDDDSSDSVDYGGSSTDIGVSDYDIGVSSPLTGVDSSSGSFDLSHYTYGVDDDKKDDGYDHLGKIDLSQFGIYSDDSSDETSATVTSSGYTSDDSDYSSIDLSQYGIGSSTAFKSEASKPEDDEHDFDVSQYLASLGDDDSSGSDDISYDASHHEIDKGSYDIPGLDFMPYLSAYEKQSTEKTLISKEPSNENQDDVKGEVGRIQESITFNDLGIKTQRDNSTVDVVHNQNKVGIAENQIVSKGAPLPDQLLTDIPYLQTLIEPVQTIPGEPPLQESGLPDIPKVDPVIPSTESSFQPELTEPYNNDISNSNVEYAIHTDRKHDIPLVRGFDIIKTAPFDWQKMISNNTTSLSDDLRQWLQR